MADEPEVVPLKAGQRVWYVLARDAICRAARLLSDGICETQKLPNGQLKQFAHLEYATADETHVLLGHESPKPKVGDPDDRARAVAQRQTHETTAPWDPSGAPGTWHLDGEAEHLAHPQPFRGDAESVQSP